MMTIKTVYRVQTPTGYSDIPNQEDAQTFFDANAGISIEEVQIDAPDVEALSTKDQIASLERLQTNRRIREAILGLDNGWLLNLNNQIALLRSQIGA